MATHSSARSAYSPAWRSSSMVRLLDGSARSWLHSSRVTSCSRTVCQLQQLQQHTCAALSHLQRADVALLVRVGRLAQQVLLDTKRLADVRGYCAGLVMPARLQVSRCVGLRVVMLKAHRTSSENEA